MSNITKKIIVNTNKCNNITTKKINNNKSLLFVLPHQLFDINYSKNIIIILWEHPYFFTKYNYHKLKLAFHKATMENYKIKLQGKNKLFYINFYEKNYLKIINNIINNNKIQNIYYYELIEHELDKDFRINILKQIKHNKICKCKSKYFMNDKEDYRDEIITRHDVFYKKQRQKYNILMTKENNPIGGKWSYDINNRNKFPENYKEPLNYKFINKSIRKKIINKSINYINKHFKDNVGDININNFVFPINSNETNLWLNHFIKNKFNNFGKYEDSISSEIVFGNHSILSLLINVGLIVPEKVINKVINTKIKIPIESLEGFVRQIIGWREYNYYMYINYHKSLQTTSLYSKDFNNRKIPNKIWNSNTLIPYIDKIIENVNKYSYTHHIERLMCIGNFFILIGLSPKEIYLWFRTMYIDSYDVFMDTNVYGMLLYAKINNKNHMMTRPYISSSNYIKNMSNYKDYNITFDNITCKWSEVIDALYYNVISIYKKEFNNNYFTKNMVNNWNKMSSNKKKNIKLLSKNYINWLYL